MSDDVVVLRKPAPCTLAELAARLRPALEAAGAERAIVFGSWARGTADGYSDLDLVVVIETDLPRLQRDRRLDGVYAALPSGMGLDLLIYTPKSSPSGWREE